MRMKQPLQVNYSGPFSISNSACPQTSAAASPCSHSENRKFRDYLTLLSLFVQSYPHQFLNSLRPSCFRLSHLLFHRSCHNLISGSHSSFFFLFHCRDFLTGLSRSSPVICPRVIFLKQMSNQGALLLPLLQSFCIVLRKKNLNSLVQRTKLFTI